MLKTTTSTGIISFLFSIFSTLSLIAVICYEFESTFSLFSGPLQPNKLYPLIALYSVVALLQFFTIYLGITSFIKGQQIVMAIIAIIITLPCMFLTTLGILGGWR